MVFAVETTRAPRPGETYGQGARDAPSRLPAWARPRRVGRSLAVAIAALAVLSVAEQFAIHVLGHDHLEEFLVAVDLDAEGNLPTWFASVTLLAAAGLAAWIGALTRAWGARYAGHWRALAVLLAAFSADEVARLHEHLGRLQPLLDTHGPLYFAWVLPGSLAALAGVVLFARFHRHLPAPTRRGLALATVLYFTGALVVEALGGWRAETMGMNNMTHSLIATVEEVLELAGVAVLVVALLRHVETFPVPAEASSRQAA